MDLRRASSAYHVTHNSSCHPPIPGNLFAAPCGAVRGRNRRRQRLPEQRHQDGALRAVRRIQRLVLLAILSAVAHRP